MNPTINKKHVTRPIQSAFNKTGRVLTCVALSSVLLLSGCATRLPQTAVPPEIGSYSEEQVEAYGKPFFIEHPDGSIERDMNESPIIAGHFTKPTSGFLSQKSYAQFFENPVPENKLSDARPIAQFVSLGNFEKVRKAQYSKYMATKEEAQAVIEDQKKKSEQRLKEARNCVKREMALAALTGATITGSKCAIEFETITLEREAMQKSAPPLLLQHTPE